MTTTTGSSTLSEDASNITGISNTAISFNSFNIMLECFMIQQKYKCCVTQRKLQYEWFGIQQKLQYQ
jgi:hypothetical protein